MGLDNPLHIAILVVVLFLIFGHRRIPAMARAIGSTKNEVRAGLRSGPAAAPSAAVVQAPAQTSAAHAPAEPQN